LNNIGQVPTKLYNPQNLTTLVVNKEKRVVASKSDLSLLILSIVAINVFRTLNFIS